MKTADEKTDDFFEEIAQDANKRLGRDVDASVSSGGGLVDHVRELIIRVNQLEDTLRTLGR